MKSATNLSTFTINNVVGAYVGTYKEDVEQSWFDSEHQVIDPEWSFVDSSGHFHAIDTKSSDIPTMTSLPTRIPCDGGCGDNCEGYTAQRFYCQLCQQSIEPAYKTVTERVSVGTHHLWNAVVYGPVIEVGTKLSALIENTGGAPRFGIAVVSGLTLESDQKPTMTLSGLTRLGFRPAN